MAIMEPGKRVRRARRHFTDGLGARGTTRLERGQDGHAGSLGISTVLEARWQRDEGAQTGPKPVLPGRLAPQKLALGLSISYDR